MAAAAAAQIGMVWEKVANRVQFALFGPALTVSSHLLIQGMNKWQDNQQILRVVGINKPRCNWCRPIFGLMPLGNKNTPKELILGFAR
jgi:hypothetical protein